MSSTEAAAATTPPKGPEPSKAPEDDSLAKAQVDGAAPVQNGSALQEPEADVEVTLADMQQDPDNPLFSAKSFEELNL